MKIVNPADSRIPALRRLWKDAFGDEDDFLDLFFSRGYSPDRCRCLMVEDQVAGALYWFDVTCMGRKMAYLYAVAVDSAHRGQGLCRALMADTHRHLAEHGYTAAILVPQDSRLREMYRNMGYQDATSIRENTVAAGGPSLSLTALSAQEYAASRRKLMPEGGVLQEGSGLELLSGLCRFYGGDGWLAAISLDRDGLRCPEFLGDSGIIPGLVSALGYEEGSFRTPGKTTPFAQILPFSPDAPVPTYFSLAFD